MNFWDTIAGGEYVMFALAALLITVIIIWGIRTSVLLSQNHRSRSMMHKLPDYIMESDIENAFRLCEVTDTSGGHVIISGLKRLGRPMPEIIASMHEAREAELPQMEKGLRWIRAIAIISPLIGLGGTLAGICDKLNNIALDGTIVDIAYLSGAIAPTIVSTIAGLIVGMISILLYFCLEGKIDRMKTELIEISEEFAELLNHPA